MKKDVLISVSGLHFAMDAREDLTEPIEVITPASYYFKSSKHYVVYDEVAEGFPETIKNTVKITGDSKIEIIKSGAMNTRMVFEKGKMNVTDYQTPFGNMLVGIHTRELQVEVEEDKIDVKIFYTLDVNQEAVSDCEISVTIRSVGEAEG